MFLFVENVTNITITNIFLNIIDIVYLLDYSTDLQIRRNLLYIIRLRCLWTNGTPQIRFVE